MPLDPSTLSPEDQMQFSMFETLLAQMPTEALELLSEILNEKIRERRS